MNLANRLTIFDVELSLIRSPAIRSFVEVCLCALPDYFFSIPASSSGKYHPAYALGEGGLVRHTKAAVRAFYSMAERAGMADYYLMQGALVLSHEDFVDCGVAALLLHDGWKHGAPDDAAASPPSNTIHEHPLIAANFVVAQGGLQLFDPLLTSAIASAIASHMGKWTTSKYSSTMLPSPIRGGWLNQLVHMADYLASRKCIEFNFDAEF